MLKILSDPILSLLFPQACSICGNSVESAGEGRACADCWSATTLFTGEVTTCFKCGKYQSPKHTNAKSFCRECNDHSYDLARAAGVYEYALSASILRLKRDPHIPLNLRKLIIESFSKTPFQDADRIIPTPLSKRRLLERGFNQAGILAKILAEKTGIVLDEASFVRTKNAKIHRAGMDRKGRKLSVEKSFEVVRKGYIQNKVILLVDDVLTSGATASVCAKVLKKNGARKVYVYTAARAV